jgi:predicted metalloprotease
MRWKGREGSANVEDRRGGGGGFPRPGKGLGLGCGGIILVIAFAMITGQDPLQLLDAIGGGASAPQSAPAGPAAAGAASDELSQFASVVLRDTEITWQQLFARDGQRYRDPSLVLFSGSVASACGYNSAAVGPFYCPGDEKVYIDLSFFNELSRRFGAPGDFAQAYVLAHEVGHHIQKVVGISERVHEAQQRRSQEEANALSVRLELQADCLAGVWAHFAKKDRDLLEPGDVEEGLRAAQVIGDDMMQRRATGTVQPESWTHGSSEMRVRWLRRGLELGDPDQCDTFQARNL